MDELREPLTPREKAVLRDRIARARVAREDAARKEAERLSIERTLERERERLPRTDGPTITRKSGPKLRPRPMIGDGSESFHGTWRGARQLDCGCEHCRGWVLVQNRKAQDKARAKREAEAQGVAA